MDDQSINEIVTELVSLIVGRAPGKIFQLGPTSLAIDFGLRDLGYLFISADPSEPRMYLIQRRVRDLEKQSIPLNHFGLALRKELAQAEVTSLRKDKDDRVARFEFAVRDELGNVKRRELVAQLTGRSANLFLLDDSNVIIQRLRSTDNQGQQPGDSYRPPTGGTETSASGRESKLLTQIRSGNYASASAAADAYFTSLFEEKGFASRAASARAEIRKKIAQQQKLLKQLQRDLDSHADAAQYKRMGDLLLANVSSARRNGNRVTLIDYFSDDAATVEIELDKSVTLQEEATRRFESYSRSKRAVVQINKRLAGVRDRLRELELEKASLEQDIAARHLAEPTTKAPQNAARGSTKTAEKVPGTRRYVSSDEMEILVGRTASDNDHLTFKVARPNDLWLHAADYGGSHVVVRNPTRKPVPQRTLIEAAQLAAWFSQAKKDPKVDVHYTERKFLSKIKGGKPGLVRLQRFKNLTVEPHEAGTRA